VPSSVPGSGAIGSAVATGAGAAAAGGVRGGIGKPPRVNIQPPRPTINIAAAIATPKRVSPSELVARGITSAGETLDSGGDSRSMNEYDASSRSDSTGSFSLGWTTGVGGTDQRADGGLAGASGVALGSTRVVAAIATGAAATLRATGAAGGSERTGGSIELSCSIALSRTISIWLSRTLASLAPAGFASSISSTSLSRMSSIWLSRIASSARPSSTSCGTAVCASSSCWIASPIAAVPTPSSISPGGGSSTGTGGGAPAVMCVCGTRRSSGCASGPSWSGAWGATELTRGCGSWPEPYAPAPRHLGGASTGLAGGGGGVFDGTPTKVLVNFCRSPSAETVGGFSAGPPRSVPTF
jgi:hypothetical protein